MNEFFTFRKLYTPVLIQFLFWIGVGVCVVEGIGTIAQAGAFRNGLGIITGLLILGVGPIAVRVICELLIAVFGIYSSLKEKSDSN
jgi:hypothetical protein